MVIHCVTGLYFSSWTFGLFPFLYFEYKIPWDSHGLTAASADFISAAAVATEPEFPSTEGEAMKEGGPQVL